MTIAKGSYACIVDSPIIMPHYIVNTKNRIPIAKCFTLEARCIVWSLVWISGALAYCTHPYGSMTTPSAQHPTVRSTVLWNGGTTTSPPPWCPFYMYIYICSMGRGIVLNSLEVLPLDWSCVKCCFCYFISLLFTLLFSFSFSFSC